MMKPLIVTTVVILLSSVRPGIRAAWQNPAPPTMRILSLPSERVQVFRSNKAADHLRLLEHNGDFLLVGARNAVYNVSASTLQERHKLVWNSSQSDMEQCILKGKSAVACNNYIRVIAMKDHDRALICGTNAYRPQCRDYQWTPSGEFTLLKEVGGEGLCPYDPDHNSTFTFADGNLYVGTVGQFSGADPLIYRKPLRTWQFDLKHLNAPQFVSSMHIGSHVYFFFRESAVEYINCGKAIYSRVARVCTNDEGGPHKFETRFTSFLKARLNCSIPGEVPFYFNELQSTSPIVEGSYNGERARLIYSVLNTNVNSISGSAVCAFRVDDIDKVFNGPFKGQEDKNSNWLPVPNSKVPEPRPGQCVNSSKSLPDVTLNFINNHPLMDQAVPSYFGRPIVVHTGFNYRYTYIAIDAQVEGVNGKMYDVLFIGTDHGHLVKVVNVASLRREHEGPVIVEEVKVFSSPGEPHSPIPVTNVLIQRSPYEQKLIVMSQTELRAVPLFHCHRAKTCHDCVGLRDPYCAWSPDERKCTEKWRRDRQAMIQDIEEGFHKKCGVSTKTLDDVGGGNYLSDFARLQSPGGPDAAAATSKMDGQPNFTPIVRDEAKRVGDEQNTFSSNTNGGAYLSSSHLYTSETLAIAVTTSIVTSLVIGFIGGYILARRCRNQIECDAGSEDYQSYVDFNRMGGLGPDMGLGYLHGGHYDPAYALPPSVGPRPINLVLNKSGKPTNHLPNPPVTQLNSRGELQNSKSAVQKVKKIYL